MVDAVVDFIPPPEAPVFEPTWDEFQEPLVYIAKIKPIAEKAGICKIRPPPQWQPPFAANVDTFKFVPRLQRLNELEAKTRVKLNFLDHLAKFWELQGTPLRIPCIERKYVDLYDLQKLVAAEGGFESVTRDRKWSKISCCLRYPTGRGIGSTLRTHYEHILYPYDLFSSGTTADLEKLRQVDAERKMKLEVSDIDKDYMPNQLGKKEEGSARRPIRAIKQDPHIDYSMNSELKKLQFYGPGPKMAIPDAELKEMEMKSHQNDVDVAVKRRKTRDQKLVTYVDLYMCRICGCGDGEEEMLLCDGCDDAFHIYCLVPPLPAVPKGDWRCPRCVASLCTKPSEAYGFEQSKRLYTLQTFGEMADQFKLDYFNMPVHKVPCKVVEKEFWRLVNSIEDEVVVKYGADVHVMEVGSGFPTKGTNEFVEDQDYVDSGWNLNNLPVLNQSVLRHISADISGMKIPWCYVGMCFSCFCWHTEDHWSYSINYMHWGEPKTWYGVPGSKAELLEECVKKNAPELFEQSPDLLHQLTTIMNPNLLQSYGVPIVRTDQHAGEFVITFPRSYHAGFNQGYNFAEAVNFCPADWLPFGRACVNHYRLLHRQCVFSHEELICKMAADPDRLDLNLAANVHRDMLAMVEQERKLRKCLLDTGTVEAEREAFELLPDDERQCDVCKTTCFLSAVTCACSPNKLACVEHASQLCKCPSSRHCLRYRYTLDELPAMLHRLKVRAESFDNWAYKVKTALEAPQAQKLDLLDLKELVTEAEEKKFPDTPLMQTLVAAISEAEKCASVANQLVCKKVRTRQRESGENKYTAKLSLEELQCFSEQVNSLPCRIHEAKLIQDLLQRVLDFQLEAVEALEEETPNSTKLEKLMEFGVTLDVDLLEIPKLKQVLQQARWLDDVRSSLSVPSQVTLDVMRKLMESGVGLAPHPACEKAMAELQDLLTQSERWEEKARICLQARPRHVITTLEAIVNEARHIPTYLPNVNALEEAMHKAHEWTSKVDSIQNGEHYPYLDVLESLVNRGRPVPVRLDQLPQLESQMVAAKSWRERTARTFLKKNTTYSLVEVLSPRNDVGMYHCGKNKKKKYRDGEKDKENGGGEGKLEEQRDPSAIVAAYKVAEQLEVEMMRELRVENIEKQQNETEAKYCVCRRGMAGTMLQCALCKDWFHSTCVPLPKSANLKNKTGQQTAVQVVRDLKFLCPLCHRSRRPRLETILSLLVSLQKLPVRLSEGEALQCLTERAMAWQDRARQALATDELASALAKLSALSQQMVEKAAREKTEKIINAELLKAASNPDLQGHLQSVAFGGLVAMETAGESSEADVASAEVAPSPATSEEMGEGTDGKVAPGSVTGMPSEHTYSTVSKVGTSGGSPSKQSLELGLERRSAPVLELSELAKAQLEELMMEGELLEVSLDETQHIWRILQACQSPHIDHVLQATEAEVYSERVKKEKMKKRKLEEGVEERHVEGAGIDRPKKKKFKVKFGKDGKIRVSGGKFKDGEKRKDGKDEKKKKKLKKREKEGGKVEKKKKMHKSRDMVDEEEDDCSAVKCLKPSGDEVNWVQCDTCEQWFHLLCVGLGEDEVAGNEEYVCFTCKNEEATIKPPSLCVQPTCDTPLVTDSEDEMDADEREEEAGGEEGKTTEEGVMGVVSQEEDQGMSAAIQDEESYDKGPEDSVGASVTGDDWAVN